MEELQPPTTLSHYRIVSKLGAGGMGEVYLAHDTTLDRKVALKVLPAAVASQHDRMERFVREAKSAAALNHPNIAHIYEIGESDGTHFIAMEFIDGETLREKIHREKTPLSKLLKYLNQVAEALAKAHGAGIVHRDLKPDNVMVTRDDYAKVLDFGLAKLIEPQNSFAQTDSASSDIATAVMAQHSTPGMVIGTIGYMSPEQASGRVNEIDHRSDIFSFGCILFEAATGQKAFAGKDVLDSLHKIVHAPAPELKDVNPLAPDELQRVVRRCLAKERDKRYQSMKEVVIELDDLQQELKRRKLIDYSVSSAPTILAPTSGAGRSEEGFWIAVLPFKYRGSNPDIETLAEGLSEDIVTGLSRFSYLRVIARSSTSRLTTETADVRSAGKELGARYVLEGSLRQSASTVRLTVQLVDASTGVHLWAETYDRQFNPEQIFALQDEVIPRIVSTCADHFGVLARHISEAVREKDPSQLTPYEALMRGFGYHHRLTPDEHAKARAALKKAVAEAPANADCWAMLSWIYSHEYAHGYNEEPGSLERAFEAAMRAVDLAPSNHFAYQTLAVALFFRKETTACLSVAERSMALNPLDASNESIFLIAFSGDWERGCSLIRRAMELNPYHPGWYRIVLSLNEYRKRNYRAAVEAAVNANVPGIYWTNMLMAAAYGQLGELDDARSALRRLVAQKPDVGQSAQGIISKWFQPDLTDHLIDGLRKAGLQILADVQASPTLAHGNTAVTATVPDFEGRPAIAVLPFDNRSNDPEQEYFAEGLAEDLIARLSLWRAFPVIARNSSFIYKGKRLDLKKMSSQLGVRYVVQGSVRKVGNNLRTTVQLIDSLSGQQIWANTYDRELTDVFAVQDEISEAIAVQLVGDLEYAEHARARRRQPENLEAWELYQRALPLIHSFTRKDNEESRALLERAVELDPQFSTALARLSEVGVWQVMYKWTENPEQTLSTAINQARDAVALDPLDAQARCNLSFALMAAHESEGALAEARRAVELNPSMPFALAIHAYHQYMAGHSTNESIALVQRAVRLSPHDPVEWLFYDVLSGAYLNAGKFTEGFEAARRLITLAPNYYWGYLWSAMNLVGLGKINEARELVQQARRINPELSFELARKCLGSMHPDVERRLIEPLQQAGLVHEPFTTAGTGIEKEAISSDRSNAGGSIIKTIAVLPFHNLSGDPEQEYFADGITEEIINALAQIPGLRVAGRSSAFSFKGRNEDLRTVGAKLDVRTILEGTVRRAGDRVRITAQLIDATNGYQMWSERYDRVMEDVFAVQDEIANTIAGRMQLSLSAVAGSPHAQPPTRHIGAYELYLKGRGLLYQRGLSIPKAIDCFTQAVALDQHYAQAWAGLADGFTTSGYSGFNRASEVMPRALEAARQALELDPNLAEAHNAFANATLLYERKYDVAAREFKRALELNPNYPQAHAWYGLFYLHWIAGREHEARRVLMQLLQLDPLSAYANVIVAFSDFTCERLSEAVDHARRGVELDPNSYLALWCLSVALKCNKQSEEAAEFAERALSVSGRHNWALTTLTSIYAEWGKPDEALAVFRELEARSQREYIQPSMLIEAAASVGEADSAIAYAQQAFDERDPLFVLMARLWPGYDQLRGDARFEEIVAQLSLPGRKT